MEEMDQYSKSMRMRQFNLYLTRKEKSKQKNTESKDDGTKAEWNDYFKVMTIWLTSDQQL